MPPNQKAPQGGADFADSWFDGGISLCYGALMNKSILQMVAVLVAAGLLAGLLAGCSQQFSVSINEQAVYDPSGRLVLGGFGGQVQDPNLQGCVNFTMSQQGIAEPQQLTRLACPDSEISQLDDISQFSQLRFLDLANNDLSDISPLRRLRALSDVNLNGNAISDISPLLALLAQENSRLKSVRLNGNRDIPCIQLDQLQRGLPQGNLQAPGSCRN